MFFRRRKAVPLSDYAPILRAALTDAVELAGFSQESCLIFISQPESTERREEGHAASFKILEKAAPLYATYKKMEAMKPEYKSARWVHHFAQRMFKYESGTAEAIVYQMQALIAND